MSPNVRKSRFSGSTSNLDALKDFLRFGHSIWKGATFQQIGFRGQSKASWNLTPKVFRRGVMLGYGESALSPPSPEIVEQTRAEYEAVRAFVELSDRVGLDLPGDVGRFRNHRDRRGADADNFWREEWPDVNDLELLAVSQHHGVSTRLLDFTYNPLVAAFFAATDCLKRSELKEQFSEFAIWGIDLRFFRTIRNIANRLHGAGGRTERIHEVQVPRHNNNFLRAQSGFFLMDEHANLNFDVNGRFSLEQVLVDRADSWRRRKGLWGATQISSFFLPYVKLRIKSELASGTLRYLHGEGINEASVFPSHDHIHPALQFMDCRGHELE